MQKYTCRLKSSCALRSSKKDTNNSHEKFSIWPVGFYRGKLGKVLLLLKHEAKFCSYFISVNKEFKIVRKLESELQCPTVGAPMWTSCKSVEAAINFFC